jgi:pSer/pThr/pTyr-binding forkhead associated (FHA) protein
MAASPVLRIFPPDHYVEIDGGTLYLGRDCHLVTFIPALVNKVVSNRHCVIRREGESWALEDLNSRNGTWMRGARIFGKVLLRGGDVFTLGKEGPNCECFAGFGGLGPQETAAEVETDALTVGVTEELSDVAADRDGTQERPYRVGKTPEVRLRHLRTGQVHSATGYTVILGRDPKGAQIVIRSPEDRHVSARHAQVQFRVDGTAVVKDLESRNGTWVNDMRVTEDTMLHANDRLVLGAAGTTLEVLAVGPPATSGT